VRAGHRTLLVPAAGLVEAPDAFEQTMRGGIQVRRQAGNLLTQLLGGFDK